MRERERVSERAKERKRGKERVRMNMYFAIPVHDNHCIDAIDFFGN